MKFVYHGCGLINFQRRSTTVFQRILCIIKNESEVVIVYRGIIKQYYGSGYTAKQIIPLIMYIFV